MCEAGLSLDQVWVQKGKLYRRYRRVCHGDPEGPDGAKRRASKAITTSAGEVVVHGADEGPIKRDGSAATDSCIRPSLRLPRPQDSDIRARRRAGITTLASQKIFTGNTRGRGPVMAVCKLMRVVQPDFRGK